MRMHVWAVRAISVASGLAAVWPLKNGIQLEPAWRVGLDAAISLVWVVAFLAIAYGLWRTRSWARKLLIAYAALLLVLSAVGFIAWAFAPEYAGAVRQMGLTLITTLVAAGAFFYLRRPDVRALFEPTGAASESKISSLERLGVLWFIVIGVLFVFAAPFVFWRASGITQPPASLAIPGVKKGAGLLNKAIAFKDSSLGPITQVRVLKDPATSRVRIAVVGSRAVAWTDEHFVVEKRVTFPKMGGQVELVGAGRDSDRKFINRGGGWQPVSLIAEDGKALWTREGVADAADDMAAGDVDGNGVVDFAIGYNGSAGVELLDEKGVSRWRRRDSNVSHVEVLPGKPNQAATIVHTNAGGSIVIRSKDGDILSTHPAPTYASFFSLCAWPAPDAPPHLLFAGDGWIWLTSPQGGMVAKFEAPDLPNLGEPRGVLIQGKDAEKMFFVLVSFRRWDRASLYAFDTAGGLLYYEVLPQHCSAITSEATAGEPSLAVLVGCQGTVFRYRLIKG